MNKWIRNMLREVEGFIDEAKYNIEYKWETRNDCPECGGAGQSLEDVVDGYYHIYSGCGWCDETGKMTIHRRFEWQWYCKIRPAIVNILKRIVPKKIQVAYEKKLYARLEKEWREEMRSIREEDMD